MSNSIRGTFEVKLSPQQNPESEEGSFPNRLLIDKQFHGDLSATSKGQMLSATTSVKGSVAYVAIEQVSGTLSGRSGTFMLQHQGIMNRGKGELSVVVVPDSGTDELTGLTGTMDIQVEDSKHFYTFDFELPQSAH